MFTKIFKVNRKSDEPSQALAICTHGVAGAKYFELPLPEASPFNVVLGTKPKVVYFGATQADLQTDEALTVLHPWISQAFAYYLIYKHDFFENQGLGIQLVYPGAHPRCGNVAAIEVIEPLRAHDAGTQVTQNGRRGTLLFAVAAGATGYAAHPAIPCCAESSVADGCVRMARMYVLLSEAGATSTRSGGLFTKCMFRVGEGKMFEVGTGLQQETVTGKDLTVFRATHNDTAFEAKVLPPVLAPMVEVKKGEKPGHGLNDEQRASNYACKFMDTASGLPHPEDALEAGLGMFDTGDLSGVSLIYDLRRGIATLKWGEGEGQSVDFSAEFLSAKTKWVGLRAGDSAKWKGKNYKSNYMITQLKPFHGMAHDSQGQKDARKALEVLWDAVIGSEHASVEETKKLTYEENVKRFFTILYDHSPIGKELLDVDAKKKPAMSAAQLETALNYTNSGGDLIKVTDRRCEKDYLLYSMAKRLQATPLSLEENVAELKRYAASDLRKAGKKMRKVKNSVATSQPLAEAATLFVLSQGQLETNATITSEDDIFEDGSAEDMEPETLAEALSEIRHA